LQKKLKIPPTEVGGSFKSFLTGLQRREIENPINGSWWIVQISFWEYRTVGKLRVFPLSAR